VEENEGQLDKLEEACLIFTGEEAEALKSFLTNSENIMVIS